MRLTSALIVILLLAVTSASQLPADNDHDHEHEHHLVPDILLPIEYANQVPQLISVKDAETAELWQKFNAENGAWTALLDPRSGNPRQALGTPIPLGISDLNDDAAITSAAHNFLLKNAEVFNINAQALEFMRLTPLGSGKSKRWYLSFEQTYQGMLVQHSEAELRINARGELFAMRLNTFNGIELNSQPSVSLPDVFNTALTGLQDDEFEALRVRVDPATVELSVLPFVQASAVNYRLVYNMELRSEHPGLRFDATVDAHSGHLLRRVATALHIQTPVAVRADVRTGLSTDAIELVGLQQNYVDIDGIRYLSDADGNINADISGDVKIEPRLEGPFIKVESQGRANAAQSVTVNAGAGTTVRWNDANSHLYERNMFYHGNIVHNWFKNIEPTNTVMDRQVVLQMWFEGNPFGGLTGNMANAFSNLDTIAFIGLSLPEMRMADGGSVLYHEYGHSINSLFAIELGGTFSNPTSQEGIADAVAAFVEDHSQVGLGVFVDEPERFIRDAENTLKYPDDITGGQHFDGQIISGAYWDLRTLTSLETATNILHFARYGLPDDPNVGTMFGEWFMESLIADDDDGDLTNGTPHCDEIIEAFDNHNIGLQLFRTNTFQHKALDNTPETKADYTVEFAFSSLDLKDGLEPSTRLRYFTSRDPNPIDIPTSVIGDGNEFRAMIPAQAAGTRVSYQIQVANSDNSTYRTISGLGAVDGIYTFLVGYNRTVFIDFEDADDWTLETPGNGSGAGWEIGDPDPMNLQDYGLPVSLEMQPDDDFSADGTDCLVTGVSVHPQNFTLSTVFGSQTFATSPVFDISATFEPLLQFQYWFISTGQPGAADHPEFRVEVSGNGGQSWFSIQTIKSSHQGWAKVLLNIPENFAKSETFRVRFIVDARAAGLTAFSNSLVDEVQILSRSDVGSSVDDSGNPANFDVTLMPNPARDEFQLSLELNKPGVASVELLDILGNAVFTRTFGPLDIGTHVVQLPLITGTGTALSPGAYLVRTVIGTTQLTRTLVVE